MVKGVNKNIIEVNETGSKVFEKIVLYVSPEYSKGGKNAVADASKDLERLFLSDGFKEEKKIKYKKRKTIVLCVILLLSLILLSGALFYLFAG